MTKQTIGITGLGLGIALGGACLETRLADHCANLDGDADCARRYPDGDRPYCALGTCEMENLDGCYATRPADDACYSPCGEDKSLEDDPSCEGVAETGTDATTTSVSETTPSTSGDPTTVSSMSMTDSETETDETDSETSSGPSGCVLSLECTDVDAPICEDEVCVACTAASDPDGACASKDASTPVCRDDGVCVQCTDANPSACVEETPLCDDGSSSCIGCTYHEQCGSSACRIATGACFEETEVYNVGSGQTYPTITAAVTDLGEGVQVVLVLHAGADFNEGVTLSGMDTAYAFMSEDVPAPQWIKLSGMSATLAVDSDAEVYVQNVRFTANTFTGAAAIEADGARIYLDRTQVVGNNGGGLALTNSTYAQVRNCFVGGAADVPAFSVDSSSVDVLYSTLGGERIFWRHGEFNDSDVLHGRMLDFPARDSGITTFRW